MSVTASQIGGHQPDSTKEWVAFLQAWMSDPLGVAALAPSSRALAAVITAEITSAHAPVIELGPGTGAFTRALLERGIPQNELTLVECSRELASRLQALFPEARVHWGNAARLGSIDPWRPGETAKGGALAGAVVSGLPLLNMPPRTVMKILSGAFGRHLRPHAAFYQFTYGPACPVPRSILDRLGLKARRIGGVLANFPPASVYRITRRPVRLAATACNR